MTQRTEKKRVLYSAAQTPPPAPLILSSLQHMLLVLSLGMAMPISIARAAVADPPVMILDEATSSIDTRTESRIQKAFDTMMKGRTSFIVAHRLSTIQEADLILVMRDGHIVEQGNHEQLLAKRGFYEQLYRSQFAH